MGAHQGSRIKLAPWFKIKTMFQGKNADIIVIKTWLGFELLGGKV